MAILKYKDIEKMNQKELASKTLELKKELKKIKVTSGKEAGKGNSKEVKKAIARILTFENTLKNQDVKEVKETKESKK